MWPRLSLHSHELETINIILFGPYRLAHIILSLLNNGCALAYQQLVPGVTPSMFFGSK